jgi:hypothetical protein
MFLIAVPDVWATELLDIPRAHRHMSPAFKWFVIIGLTNSRLFVEQFACQSIGR